MVSRIAQCRHEEVAFADAVLKEHPIHVYGNKDGRVVPKLSKPDVSQPHNKDTIVDVIRGAERATERSVGYPPERPSELKEREFTRSRSGRKRCPESLLDSFGDCQLFLNEGVDAGGLAVEEVGDRPLLTQARDVGGTP
jgi:hypothetical protein